MFVVFQRNTAQILRHALPLEAADWPTKELLAMGVVPGKRDSWVSTSAALLFGGHALERGDLQEKPEEA